MTAAFSPVTLAEARKALTEGAVKVAGCTDLLVIDHAQGREHASVLDVLGIRELQGIREVQGGVAIGAASTFTAIRDSVLLREHATLLQDAARTIGAAQIQNRATIGGNIANASPAGDSLPALLALGATILVNGPRGQRSIPYESFHTGYRTTQLAKDELIETIVLPLPTPSIQVFRKVGTREAQAISKVVVGFSASRSGVRLSDVRLAMGSVAPTPIRLPEIEMLIASKDLSAALADQIGDAVSSSISPIDDVRSSAEYRSRTAGRVVRRILLNLLVTK